MIELGKKQTLILMRTVSFGAYLKESEDDASEVLLPKAQIPAGAKKGDRIEVFVYKDSEDRPVATTQEPKLSLHEIGRLPVKAVTRIGAFLDWGLEKDLLLPFHEQPKERVKENDEVLVAVYLDKSDRLCATMNVYPYLENKSPYRTGDEVEGTVYETSGNFGVFVAVDDCYSALIPKKEVVREFRVGEKIKGRVTSVRPDGKLNLSVREKAYLQIAADTEKILEKLKENGGVLPFSEKADPALIRREMGMSKNEFKRALGRLLKEGRIRIGETKVEEIL